MRPCSKKANPHNMDVLTNKVEEALNEIRPFLEADNGNIELVRIAEDHTAYVRFMGACSVCTMNAMTLRAGVEESIRRAAPEIKAVVAVE